MDRVTGPQPRMPGRTLPDGVGGGGGDNEGADRVPQAPHLLREEQSRGRSHQLLAAAVGAEPWGFVTPLPQGRVELRCL